MSWHELATALSTPREAAMNEADLWSLDAYQACDRLIRDITSHPVDYESLPDEAIDAIPASQLPLKGRWEDAWTNASQVLRSHALHLRVLNLALVACYKVHGIAAFNEVARAYSQLLDSSWESIEPNLADSAKSRASTMLWLARQLQSLGEEAAKAAAEGDDAQEAATIIDELTKRRVSELPGAQQDVLPKLRKSAESFREAARKYAQRMTQRPTVKTSSDVDGEEELDEPTLLRRLLKTADSLLEIDPQHELGHLVLRRAVWTTDPGRVVVDEQFHSMLPAPDVSLVAVCQNMLAGEGNSDDMLTLARKRISEYPHWLDLQLVAHRALTELGAESAAKVVAEETARYSARAKDLFQQGSYQGGSVFFASPVVRDWLNSLSFESSTAGSGMDASATADGATEDSPLHELRQMVGSGKSKPALNLCIDLDRPESSLAVRIELRLLAAQCLLKIGKRPRARSACEAGMALAREASFAQLFPGLERALLETLLATADSGRPITSVSVESPESQLLALSLESLRSEAK